MAAKDGEDEEGGQAGLQVKTKLERLSMTSS